MVMDATANVQCLGREFVRQYYTLLHEAPSHLHRFYSNDSCFVHGGLDTQNRETKPVFGQRQIHQRIQQLSFRDCHARIAQVDSHATHANGVVVQVTGELSNNGQPMRRFMQTFVLAPQSPKRYYVHNDIFRYQDDNMDEEEPEQESDQRESEEEIESDPHAPLEKVEQVTDDYFNKQVPTVNGSAHIDEVPIPVSPPASEEVHVEPQQSVPPPVATPVTPTTPVTRTSVSPPPMPAPAISPASVCSDHKESPPPLTTPEEPKSVEIFEEEVLQAQQPEAITSAEPKTYAHFLKSGGSSSFSSAVSSISPTSSKQTTSPSSDQTSRQETKDFSSPNMISQPQRSSRPRGNSRGSITGRGEHNWMGGRSSGDDSGSISGGDGDRRRGGSNNGQGYPDSHQLFLGNLPHNLTEDDLKEVFSMFGSIVDLRIHSKSNAKSGSGARVPNYGFLIYETPDAVQTALSNRPIRWPHPNGQTVLNVEEKKTRSRQDGGRMGGGDMGRSGGSGRGGSSMRGGGGMGGAPRGGRGGMSSYSNRGEGRGGSVGRSYRPR